MSSRRRYAVDASDRMRAMTADQPQTLGDYIDAIRAALVCDQCGRYVGSLAAKKYLPPPYPVAVDKIEADDEVAALIAFEWHMVGRLRRGNFAIRHPQRDGRCMTMREWLEAEEAEADEDEDAQDGEEE